MISVLVVRRVLGGTALALALALCSSLPVAASGPEIVRHSSFSYGLADALADFAADPAGNTEVDCGSFKVIAIYDVTRDIFTWPDHQVRHVVYTGFFVNASDPSKMLPRNGDFERTNWFDAAGDFVRSDTRGIFIWSVIDGRRVNMETGYSIDDGVTFLMHGLQRDEALVCPYLQ